MTLERSCEAGAGLSILIQHLKIGSPTRFGAGEQAPGGSPQGRSLKALGGHPPRFTNVGQCRGLARPSGALLFPGPPPFAPGGSRRAVTIRYRRRTWSINHSYYLWLIIC